VSAVQFTMSVVHGLPSLHTSGFAWHWPVVMLQIWGSQGSEVQFLSTKEQLPSGVQESMVHGLPSSQTTGMAAHRPVVVLQDVGLHSSGEEQVLGINWHVALLFFTTQESSVQRLPSSQVTLVVAHPPLGRMWRGGKGLGRHK